MIDENIRNNEIKRINTMPLKNIYELDMNCNN
jgi:hypothetical protein